MGLAAPLGSLLSSVICLVLFVTMLKKAGLFSASGDEA
jgi:hypothetical protein